MIVKAGLMTVCSLLMAASLIGGQPGLASASVSAGVETRCGWFSNPTPANASLYDRDGQWTIGAQGGYQAEGDWPSFGPKQWVETNGHYGHGCACLRVQVDHQKGEVIKIESARARPLSACRRDRALKRWGFK
jgi:hypothetical protein